MTNELKLVVRTILVGLVAFAVAWQAADYNSTKAALGGALIAGVTAVLELLGPTSDVAVKWSLGGSNSTPAKP